MDRRRIGLGHRQRVAADDRVEPLDQPQRVEQQPGIMLALVGDDANPHAQRGELVERGDGTGEGAAMDGYIGGIIGQERIEQLLESLRHQRRHTSSLYAARQHQPCSAADGGADLRRRQWRNIGQRQRMIGGGAQILRRIDQGAIEIETDDGKREVAHRQCDAAR